MPQPLVYAVTIDVANVQNVLYIVCKERVLLRSLCDISHVRYIYGCDIWIQEVSDVQQSGSCWMKFKLLKPAFCEQFDYAIQT